MATTPDEIRKIVYAAVYRVIRQPNPPMVIDFLKMKVKDILDVCKASDPTDWPKFWEEALAVEIQSSFRARKEKEHIIGFDVDWLCDNQDKTWEEVCKYIDDHIAGEVKV